MISNSNRLKGLRRAGESLAETRSFLQRLELVPAMRSIPPRKVGAGCSPATDAVLRNEAAATEERAAMFDSLAEALEKFKQ